MCGSKGTATTTSSYSPPASVQANYDFLANQAKQVAATPFTPYTGEMVAGLTPTQQAGIQNVNAAAAEAQPYYQTAAGLVGNAAQTFGQPQLDQYMSPYINSVAKAAQANINETNAQQQQQLLGNAISQGAFGGDRAGIAQAELARQQGLSAGQTMANIYQGGYGQALAQFNADQGRQLQAGSTFGQLGTNAQAAGLSGAQAQMAAGATQQAVQQAQDVANQQQFQAQQAYPFQTTQYLGNLLLGIGGQSGGTALTAQPQGNIGSSLVGGLLAAGQLMKPFNKGGVVAHDKDSMGGAVHEDNSRENFAVGGDSQSGSDLPYYEQPTGGSTKALTLADVMRIKNLGKTPSGKTNIPEAKGISDTGEIDPNKIYKDAMSDPTAKANLQGWANKLIGRSPGTVPASEVIGQGQGSYSLSLPYASGGLVGRHGYATDGFVADPTVSDYAARSARVGENIGSILENLNRAPSYEGRGKTLGEALYGAPLSDEANMGLLAAGIGMMGSKSPIFGLGIAEGAQQGYGAYFNALKNKRDYTQKLMEDQQKAYGTAAENAYRSSMLPIEERNALSNATQAKAAALTAGTKAFDTVRGYYSIGDKILHPDPAHPEGYVVGPGGTNMSFDQYRQAMAAHLQNLGVFDPAVIKIFSDPSMLGTSPALPAPAAPATPAAPKSRGGEMMGDDLNKAPATQPEANANIADKPVQVAQAAPTTMSDAKVDASPKKDVSLLTDYDKLAQQELERYNYYTGHPEFDNSKDLAVKALENYKTFSALAPTVQAQSRDLEAKKTEATKRAEGNAAVQNQYQENAQNYVQNWAKDMTRLKAISKIAQLVESNRLSEIKANFAGFLREFNVDHFGPFDLGNIESANDTTLKNALVEAMSQISEGKLGRAPSTGLGVAMKTVADPKVSPGSKYSVITQTFAEELRKYQQYMDWYKAGRPDTNTFLPDWESDPKHDMGVYLQKAVDQNPYFAGMTEGEQKQLLQQRKLVSDTSENGEGTPKAPVAPAGTKMLKFDAKGNLVQ